MAITPDSKSNAKPFKVQNMVKDINDEPETIEALVQDIQVAPDGTELFETNEDKFNGLYNNVEDDIDDGKEGIEEPKIELIKLEKDGGFACKVKDCKYRSPRRCIVKRHLEKMHKKENISLDNSTFIDDPKPEETEVFKGEENLDDDFDENQYFDNNEAEGKEEPKIELIKRKKDGFFACKVKDCNYRSPRRCIVKRHLEKMHKKENIIMNNSTFIDDPKPEETEFLKGTENFNDDFDGNHYFDNNEAEGTNLSSDELMKTLELDSMILKKVAINGFVSHFVCKDCGYQSARKWGVKRHLVSKHKIG